MSEPQNLKDHQISKRTQITNVPHISKEPHMSLGKIPMTPKLQKNRKF